MNDIKQVEIKDNRDLSVILLEKLKESQNSLHEHTEKTIFHQQQVDFHKKRVEYLTKFVGEIERDSQTVSQ